MKTQKCALCHQTRLLGQLMGQRVISTFKDVHKLSDTLLMLLQLKNMSFLYLSLERNMPQSMQPQEPSITARNQMHAIWQSPRCADNYRIWIVYKWGYWWNRWQWMAEMPLTERYWVDSLKNTQRGSLAAQATLIKTERKIHIKETPEYFTTLKM